MLAAVVFAWYITDRIFEKTKSPVPLYLLYFLICAADTVILRLFQEKYPADILNVGLLKFSASLPCVTYALHNYLYDFISEIEINAGDFFAVFQNVYIA